MDERIAVSAVCTHAWSFEQDLAFWQESGIAHVGLSLRKLHAAGLPAGAKRVADAGLRVSSLGEIGWFRLDEPESWPRHHDRLRLAIETATMVGSPPLILVSGPAGRLTWDEAAAALADALAPVLEEARAAGVALALENTHSLRLDYSFVHSLRDALDVAESLGVGLCMEVNSCWAERGLASTISRAADAIRLVQVSDFVVGSTSYPDRAPLGEGHIPFDRVLGALLHAGCEGPFEIELIGPRIVEQGYRASVARSVEYLDRLLGRLP